MNVLTAEAMLKAGATDCHAFRRFQEMYPNGLTVTEAPKALSFFAKRDIIFAALVWADEEERAEFFALTKTIRQQATRRTNMAKTTLQRDEGREPTIDNCLQALYVASRCKIGAQERLMFWATQALNRRRSA